MAVRVAVVTGGNKGIGLEIVRSLCRHLGENGVVYLTARNEERGLAAVELLKKDGLAPVFYKLDLNDRTTIDTFRDHVEKMHSGIDILVNNAGLGTPRTENISEYERAVRPIRTNVFGFLDVCHALLPLIRSGGRVVNLSSTTANMSFCGFSEELKARWRQVVTEDDIVILVNEFIEALRAGNTDAHWMTGYGYSISKLGVVVLSRVHAQNITDDRSRADILINACCPGFVKTDMSAGLPDDHFGGERLCVSDGADTPVYLALLPKDTKQPHGQFVLRRQIYDFVNTDMFIQI